MGEQKAKTYRGKGTSTTKFAKNGEPKHAGNWSATTIRYQSLQFRDYPCNIKHYPDGSQLVIIGDHTPLHKIYGEEIGILLEALMVNDPHFKTYTQQGTHTIGAKQYDARRTITKNTYSYSGEVSFRYREEIYTLLDFNYQFPEY